MSDWAAARAVKAARRVVEESMVMMRLGIEDLLFPGPWRRAWACYSICMVGANIIGVQKEQCYTLANGCDDDVVQARKLRLTKRRNTWA